MSAYLFSLERRFSEPLVSSRRSELNGQRGQYLGAVSPCSSLLAAFTVDTDEAPMRVLLDTCTLSHTHSLQHLAAEAIGKVAMTTTLSCPCA